MTSIYLAGKISKNDWRSFRGTWEQHYDSHPRWEWPVLKDAVHGMDLVGPFFISCDHGCAHGPETHGMGGGEDIEGAYPAPSRQQITELCFDAIRRADVFFAWLSQEKQCEIGHVTAYGTLVELGYAHAIGKTIIVATNGDPQPSRAWSWEHRGDGATPTGELWFGLTCATDVLIADEPWIALKQVADLYTAKLESPLEEAFWRAYLACRDHRLEGLVTQYEVQAGDNKYRLDFAIPAKKIAFEMDGYTYHSDREAWARDRRRDLDLSALGWRVHRFDGDMIRDNPHNAMRFAGQLAEQV